MIIKTMSAGACIESPGILFHPLVFNHAATNRHYARCCSSPLPIPLTSGSFAHAGAQLPGLVIVVDRACINIAYLLGAAKQVAHIALGRGSRWLVTREAILLSPGFSRFTCAGGEADALLHPCFHGGVRQIFSAGNIHRVFTCRRWGSAT